jgi:hypothetical protein
MLKMVCHNICVLLIAVCSLGGLVGAQQAPPNPATYTPNIFIRADLEHYYIVKVETEVWRDGKKSGFPYREFSGLPDHCWAIQYTFVWNDESPSSGHKPGTPDPEPVIVFVSDAGTVVGVQSRWHGTWLPINSTLFSWDFIDGTHIMVGFWANVHTPGAGLLPTVVALGAGNLGSDVAAALRWLEDMIGKGIVKNGGH